MWASAVRRIIQYHYTLGTASMLTTGEVTAAGIVLARIQKGLRITQ
jgi:hypothetical protein